MTRFKEGDRVRYLGGRCSEVGGMAIGTVCEVDSLTDNGIDFHAIDGSHDCWGPYENFELIGGAMNVGDILVDDEGETCKVLAYLNQGVELVALSENDQYDEFDKWYTVNNIKACGWKVKTDTTVEKTVSDLEKELNMQPGTLRIKKEDAN